jgi:aryl-alcohol dehydrogenase-like predicted oxidoreductase
MSIYSRTSPIAGAELEIPRATIGTMMFGSRADPAESARIVDTSLDCGINFFDTANMYNDGESERILGKILSGRREQAIIATKVGYGKDADGCEEGTSRAAILRAIDLSLDRLGTDYVDIYYLHRPDKVAPVEESLTTLMELIEAGKIRHFGLSNFGGWHTYEALALCEQSGCPRPVMSQMILNMLVRQIEFEFTRLCEATELHLTVYNPLAGGLLTGKYTTLQDENEGGRFVNNAMYRQRYWNQRMLDGAHALQQIADGCGMPLTHLALCWCAQRPYVNSILLGPSSTDQLLDCLAAGEKTIPEDAMAKIDEALAEFDGSDACYAR